MKKSFRINTFLVVYSIRSKLFYTDEPMNLPARLGSKYILLDTLGVGGMAEIFRGKLIGDEGFEKLIVIKKLLQQHNANQEIISHFIDEARLAALLEHENIASTYDFGNIDGVYFIAMEYLFGKDLYTAMQKMAGLKLVFPPEIALFIIDKMCDAMEYAHNVRDLKNNPLNIIHRDLTPHNIFLTYDGKIKVIDFGIAKTRFHEHRTQMGIVKGKVSYMSPEQVAGSDLDSRSDIFSIGIVLYEMLCGQKLYDGNTAEVLSKALNAEFTPINEHLPSLPQPIIDIVNKALQAKTESRFQSCAQMQTAIHEYLHSLDQQVTVKTIKEFTVNLFHKEYQQESRTTTEFIDKTVYFSTKKKMADQLVEELDRTTILRIGKQKRGLAHQILTILSENPILAIPLAAIVALAAFSLSTYFLYTPTTDIPLAATVVKQSTIKNTPSVQQEKVTPPVQPIHKSENRKKWQERVEELLNKANLAYSDNNLVDSDDSAHTIYLNVLLLDKNNPHALHGIERIANQLDTNARESAAKMLFSRADKGLGYLVKFYPERLENTELKQYIQQRKQDRIAVLAEKAEEALRSDKLKTPEAESAYTLYNEIKSLNKNDSRWQDGYEKIADRYAKLAIREFKNMQMEKAKALVHEGLSLDPTNPELLNLEKDLNRKGVVPYAKGFLRGIQDIELF